jgi:hypothetical protein
VLSGLNETVLNRDEPERFISAIYLTLNGRRVDSTFGWHAAVTHPRCCATPAAL